MPASVRILALSLLLVGPALIGCVEDEDPPVLGLNQENPDNSQSGSNQTTGNQSSNNQTTDNQSSNNSEPTPTGPAIDGEACGELEDCEGTHCLSGSDWPDGYCSTLGCSTYEDCANDESFPNACLINPNGTNFCVRLCDPNLGSDDCRDGYQCRALSGDNGWCAVDSSGGTGPGPGGETPAPEDIPLDIVCQSVSGQYVDIPFEIADTTASYMMVPFSGNGQTIYPIEITTPSGNTINFQGDNDFQALGAQLFGVINPTVVPAVPQFSSQFETGAHTYRLFTNDNQMCYYLLEAPAQANVIDLNLYLVGFSSVNASNAATNNHIQTMLARAEAIYQQQGISLGDVRYFDVPQEVADAYSVIHSEGDIRELVSHSVDPEETGGSTMSANIFIVQSFAMGGALGLSLGIPGAAGFHSSRISGVALTGEYLGSTNGNNYTGNILAHELGHFLGLFHTSETTGQHFDPLDDTPECHGMSNPLNCPDWGNLMFPSAAGGNTDLTNDQGFVLQVNPLTK